MAAFDATPANIDARTQRFEAGGLKAAVLAKPTRGGAAQAMLSLRIGDEQTLFGQAAAAEAAARLLDKGSATLSRQQVQDRLDALKTEMSVQPGVGVVRVVLSSRREHLAEAVALVDNLTVEPVPPVGVSAGLFGGMAGAVVVAAAGLTALGRRTEH